MSLLCLDLVIGLTLKLFVSKMEFLKYKNYAKEVGRPNEGEESTNRL